MKCIKLSLFSAILFAVGCAVPPDNLLRTTGAANIDNLLGRIPVAGTNGNYESFFLKFQPPELPNLLNLGAPPDTEAGKYFGMVCQSNPSGGSQTCDSTELHDSEHCAIADLCQRDSGALIGTVDYGVAMQSLFDDCESCDIGVCKARICGCKEAKDAWLTEEERPVCVTLGALSAP
jgi:hypothetical protein